MGDVNWFVIYVIGVVATFCLVLDEDQTPMPSRLFKAFGYALIWPVYVVLMVLAA